MIVSHLIKLCLNTPMDMHAIRRRNLRDLIESQGGSVASFARASGISEARLSQLLSQSFRGGRNFGEKMARKIEQQWGLPPLALDEYTSDDLMTATREHLAYTPPLASREGVRYGITTRDIEIYKLLVKPGGADFDTRPEVYRGDQEQVGVRLSWMYGNKLSPKNLLATKVADESMAPSLFPGDVVVINLADKLPVDGAVFAMGYEGDVLIRRITRDSGQWWLSADSPDQRKFVRKAYDEQHAFVIGRVVLRETEHI